MKWPWSTEHFWNERLRQAAKQGKWSSVFRSEFSLGASRRFRYWRCGSATLHTILITRYCFVTCSFAYLPE